VSLVYAFTSAAPAVRELVWRPYFLSLTAAIGEVAGQPGAAVNDASRHWVLLWKLLRRQPALAAAYHRLPFRLRNRVWILYASPSRNTPPVKSLGNLLRARTVDAGSRRAR
jgi:hypothetical protein